MEIQKRPVFVTVHIWALLWASCSQYTHTSLSLSLRGHWNIFRTLRWWMLLSQGWCWVYNSLLFCSHRTDQNLKRSLSVRASDGQRLVLDFRVCDCRAVIYQNTWGIYMHMLQCVCPSVCPKAHVLRVSACVCACMAVTRTKEDIAELLAVLTRDVWCV